MAHRGDEVFVGRGKRRGDSSVNKTSKGSRQRSESGPGGSESGLGGGRQPAVGMGVITGMRGNGGMEVFEDFLD